MCRIDIREASIRDVTFVLMSMILVVFIFVLYLKRYIERSRFQIFTTSGMPYADLVPKMMYDEIEECLSLVASIRKEPQLLPTPRAAMAANPTSQLAGGLGPGRDIVNRMKTVDAMKQLDAALAEAAPSLKRRPFVDVRRHLCDPRVTGGPLKLASLDVVNDFVSLYEHARFDPGFYGPEKLDEYNELLKQLLYSIQSAAATSGKPGASHRSSISGPSAGVSGGVAQTSSIGQQQSVPADSQLQQQQPEQERLLPMSSTQRRPLLAES